jgi:hypothetical protein
MLNLEAVYLMLVQRKKSLATTLSTEMAAHSHSLVLPRTPQKIEKVLGPSPLLQLEVVLAKLRAMQQLVLAGRLPPPKTHSLLGIVVDHLLMGHLTMESQQRLHL